MSLDLQKRLNYLLFCICIYKMMMFFIIIFNKLTLIIHTLHMYNIIIIDVIIDIIIFNKVLSLLCYLLIILGNKFTF